jgi:hypothetical protein
MKITALSVFFTLSLNLFSQKDTIFHYQKLYKVFFHLSQAKKAHPDSVIGLYLCCENLKAFPKEILKYKNLKYLSFEAEETSAKIVQKNFSLKEKQEYSQRKKMSQLSWVNFPYYNSNNKITIPDEIGSLKNLEVLRLGLLDDTMSTYHYIKKLERLLPKTQIIPSAEEFKTNLLAEPLYVYPEEG